MRKKRQIIKCEAEGLVAHHQHSDSHHHNSFQEHLLLTLKQPLFHHLNRKLKPVFNSKKAAHTSEETLR